MKLVPNLVHINATTLIGGWFIYYQCNLGQKLFVRLHVALNSLFFHLLMGYVGQSVLQKCPHFCFLSPFFYDLTDLHKLCYLRCPLKQGLKTHKKNTFKSSIIYGPVPNQPKSHSLFHKYGSMQNLPIYNDNV